MQLSLIKLGGSLITDKSKPLSLRQQALAGITREVGDLFRSKPQLGWLIGNGAGSFGHYMVRKVGYSAKPADPAAFAAVHNSVTRLNQHVVEALIKAGVPAIGLPAASLIKDAGEKTLVNHGAIHDLLRLKLVPVMFGDVIIDSEKGSRVISTEEILDVVARELVAIYNYKINSCVYATSVGGVLNEKQEVLTTLKSTQQLSNLGRTEGFDVTGGMAQKVAAGFRALDYAEYVAIVNGQERGQLSQAINHRPAGTRLVN